MSRKTAIRLLFAVLAIAFFATPVALRALGVTAEAFENRRFAESPKLSQGWDAFEQTTRFLVDRMPLRAQAVRANTRIWTDVFGTTPRYGSQSTLAGDAALPFAGTTEQDQAARPAAADTAAQVLAGRDDWLFLTGEQDRSCEPFLPFAQALGRWRALIASIRGKGARVLLVVPPDKGSVYPEHLPQFAGKACALRGKRTLWRMLRRQDGRSRVVGLRDVLLRRKRTFGDDLYARKDSHWSTLGSLALVRAVLRRVGGSPTARTMPVVKVRAGEVVDPGRAEYVGDLTRLLGAPETDTQARREIRREPTAPRVPGRTVLVGDSYSDAPVPQLTPYFDDLRVLSWVNTPAREVARAVARADTVLLETVEREFTYRAATLVPELQVLLRYVVSTAPGRATPR
jgi:alginate O-acetyltransferase complex protein AlgJ